MTKAPGIGDKAPDFTLPTDGGGTLSLQSLSGQKIVLYFYPKDDTSGCTKEAIDFNRLKPEFTRAGAVVIGVSADTVASHDKFKAKYGLELPLISDENKTMLGDYGVWVEKSMYGKKYMGVERTTVLIDAQGMVNTIWAKVKVPGHAEDVLKAARAIAQP